VAAVFDFDGTLSRGTSGIRFYRHLLGSARCLRMLVGNLPAALGYALRWHDEACLERFNHYVFKGRPADEVRRAAAAFARDSIPRFLIPGALARLEAHRSRGDRCILVSRAYTWCLDPWARTVGITDVIGTNLEIGPDGRLTGRMTEPSCDAAHKRTRLLALLGARERWEIHAYGDSAGDHAMLAAADFAFIRHGRDFRAWRN
jgi:phosphatidylglycerophosphatase C